MSDNFLYQIPGLSGKQDSRISEILNEFIDCFLLLNRKDSSVAKDLPEENFVKFPFIFTSQDFLNLVKRAFQKVLYYTDFSNDLSFLTKFVQTEFEILLCIFILVESTNLYIAKQFNSDMKLRVSKAYNTFKRRNEKESDITFLAKTQDLSIEDRLYLLSTIKISQLQMILSHWFIDFFSIYKKKIIGFLQNKKLRLPMSVSLSKERKKKVLNIKLGSSDYQLSHTNHVIKSQSIKLIS
jgi:hypothetical protein